MEKLLRIGVVCSILCTLSNASSCVDSLGEVKGVEPLLKKTNTELEALTVGLNSDKIVSTVIALSQSLPEQCAYDAAVIRLRTFLEKSYLKKLTALPTDLADLDIFFRAFMVPSTEFKKLSIKLKKNLIHDRKDIKRAFGGYTLLRGIPIVGSASVQRLEKVIAKVCADSDPCAFWNSRTLFRVVITKRPGIAAFIPEIATLILSTALLRSESLLDEFVLAHELSHVWITSLNLKGIEIVKDFSGFSGWSWTNGKLNGPKVATLGAWTDSLAILSNESPFSILPDAVIINDNKDRDGFVTHRSFRESIGRNDPAEDLADHIAAFFVMPSRYCWKSQLIAPKKLAWLEREFGKKLNLICTTNR